MWIPTNALPLQQPSSVIPPMLCSWAGERVFSACCNIERIVRFQACISDAFTMPVSHPDRPGTARTARRRRGARAPPARPPVPLFGGQAEGVTDGSSRSASVARSEHERRDRGGSMTPIRPPVVLGSCGDARISISGPKTSGVKGPAWTFQAARPPLGNGAQR